MALEFEQLSPELEAMGQRAAKRARQEADYLAAALARWRSLAGAWDVITPVLAAAAAPEAPRRLARPVAGGARLDEVFGLPAAPERGTLLAADGSQIVPDRHAPYLYYLLNVGGLVYRHGSGEPPEELSRPRLCYEDDDLFLADGLLVDGAIVGARRDRAEIELLAELAEACRHEAAPILAILDQRLLYWPASRPGWDRERNDIVLAWLAAMTRIREAGALLAGYLDRSRKNAVLALLQALDEAAGDPVLRAGASPRLTDVDLFARLLAPGQRSQLFADLSRDNRQYAEHAATNEVCFFYVNVASRGSHIARVDIPRWVVDDPVAVDQVHALLVGQCQILNGYPYGLTRADELAVVGRRDQEELENWIALRLAAHGVAAEATAKAQAKELARAGRTRFRL